MTTWTRARLTSAGITGTILLGTAATLLWLRGRLPERIPAHYGLDGQPDRWGARDSELALVFGLSLVACLLLGFVGLLSNRRGDAGYTSSVRQLLIAAPVTSAVVAAVTLPDLALLSRGATVGAGPWQTLAAGTAAGAVAALTWALLPQPRPTEETLPTRDVALAPGARAVWTGTAANAWPAVAACLGTVALAVLAIAVDVPLWFGLLLLATEAALLVLGAGITRLRVTIDPEGVHWSLPIGIRGAIAAADITAVDVVDVRPMEHGGWGYHSRNEHGPAWVIRGGAALRVTTGSGHRKTLTVDDAATGAAVAARLFGLA